MKNILGAIARAEEWLDREEDSEPRSYLKSFGIAIVVLPFLWFFAVVILSI